jgi:NAD+ diphosphatase
MPFLPANRPHAEADDRDALHILVGGQSVQLVDLAKGDDPFDVPDSGESLYLGALDGQCVYAHDKEPDAGLPLMALWGRIDEERWTIAGRAVQLVEWRRTHKFCGRCAAPTEQAGPPNDRAMQCPSCGLLAFPRLAPAIIVLVTRDDGKALLARGANFPVPMYSCLAGFVEPGETMEQAVHREVREEVGIELTEVAYWGSQPWPFPHSLMLGFTARYASGEIVLDEGEIMDAQWHSPDDLPMIPPAMSIARRLIDAWCAGDTP